ncbi:hypothetical protein ACJMK2_023875 [Sinanodonta woodiana]|uniref:Uncharacterized protein n=1 Tax=Sinanodonta woodiana TaxID=1069815 RepID=A0ABD3T675_SINWO
MALAPKKQKFDYETVNEIFKNYGTEIRKQIDTINIIPAMSKYLTVADLQPVACLCKNEGPMRAADVLMDIIKRKPKSFVLFICTVHEEGYADIVEKIRDYLWKRHTTLLTYLDEKLQKKGLKIKSKNVMVVGPLGPQALCDTPPPLQPPVTSYPLQPHSGQGQGQPQFGQEPAANRTVHQQPVHAPIVQSREVPKLPAVVQPNPIQLPGTTNIPHSTDIVTELPYNLFSKLSEELHRGDQSNWRQLAMAFSFLKRSDVKKLEKEKSPGEALLDMLGEKECTVNQLAKALESTGLQSVLDILQEHYGQLGFVSPSNIQEPVNRQQQQEQHAVLNQSLSASATGQRFSEPSQNMVFKETLDRVDENNLNMALEQSTKSEVKTKNLNIPGDPRTDISNKLDALNICDSQTRIFLQAVPEPQNNTSADETVPQSLSQVSLENNNAEMLVGDYQHSGMMLNTACEGQSSENVTFNNPTEVEDDPLGKSALHNADIDRLHLQQEVHQQDQQQYQPNTSLNGSFRDIHNDPGHVTMPMDSQIRNIAET